MAVSGLTAASLAYEGARRVPDERERMVLTGAASRAFLDDLIDPPSPADKLVAAFDAARQVELGLTIIIVAAWPIAPRSSVLIAIRSRLIIALQKC